MGTVFVHPSMENVMQIIFRITCPRTEGDTETFIQKVEQHWQQLRQLDLIFIQQQQNGEQNQLICLVM